jgi:hypothetical protein
MDFVYKAKSQYPSRNHKKKVPRNGIFAKQDIEIGDIICGYSGSLVHRETAKDIDATYWFPELPKLFRFVYKGYDLFGDGVDGTLGHYCNRLPNNAFQNSNAELDFKTVYEVENVEYFLKIKRINTFLIAKKNINKDEEITMQYSPRIRPVSRKHVEAPHFILPKATSHVASEPDSLKERVTKRARRST